LLSVTLGVAGEEAHILTAVLLDLLTLRGDRSLGELMLGLREGKVRFAASALVKAMDGYSSSNEHDTLQTLLARLTLPCIRSLMHRPTASMSLLKSTTSCIFCITIIREYYLTSYVPLSSTSRPLASTMSFFSNLAFSSKVCLMSSIAWMACLFFSFCASNSFNSASI
jgi:hypothetical protein